MIFTYSCPVPVREIEPDRKLALFKARKMLPEYVFDTTQLEKNPVTFPEVQTLLDGTTIGGHKVSDVEQVLNIRDAWNALLSSVSAGTFTVDVDTFNSVHACIARGEALEWGKFRRGQIGIAGTETYKAPDWRELPEIFDRELPVILDAESAVERAVRAMPTMLTIRQTAATGILPETALRRMRKMGQLPGVEVGERKFLVNYERLVDLLNGTFEGIQDGEKSS